MRTTYDAIADAAYIELVPEIEPGRSVRNIVTESPTGQIIALDFDRAGILLGVEVLGARSILDTKFIDGAERLDQQAGLSGFSPESIKDEHQPRVPFGQ
nr:DUF2283 domain-containing protein [Microbacterium bovistercoris]